MTKASSIFADWATAYRQLGYWPRPITLGSKACHLKDWQRPDSEILPAEREAWTSKHANLGIGLLMGSLASVGRCFAIRRAPASGKRARCSSSASAPSEQPRVPRRGRREQALRQGRRMPVRQEALRNPADDPSRNRAAVRMVRKAASRGQV